MAEHDTALPLCGLDPADLAAEEHGPAAVHVPASLGGPGLPGRDRGGTGQRGQDASRRRPARRGQGSADCRHLYAIGTRAVIKKMARGEIGIEVLVQGMERVTLVRLEQTEPYLKAKVQTSAAPRG